MNQATTQKRLKVALPMLSKDLQIGLFVVDVDCGWQNTPFLLEGLLIASHSEIATIRALTQRVTVDPSRSILEAFSARYAETIYEGNVNFPRGSLSIGRRPSDSDSNATVRAGIGLLRLLRQLLRDLTGPLLGTQTANKTKPTSAKARQDAAQMAALIAMSPAAKREAFPLYLNNIYASVDAPAKLGWLDRIAGWFGMLLDNGSDGSSKRLRPVPLVRPDFIPAEIELIRYPEIEATALAVPRALDACEISHQALVQIARDVRANGSIDAVSLQRAADTLAENMIARPATMMLATRMRDENDRIYQHGLGVAIYLTMLGRHLGFQREPLAELATIGMLLDLGKMDLDQTLLDKPGQLNEDEKKIMETHVGIGVEILRKGGVRSELVLGAIADHHERVDGLGYPNGRSDEELTIYAKMAAIADGFVAMIGPRPYAPTMSTYEALRSLFAEAGTRWHAPLVEQFVQSIGVFPVGSLVELSTGEIAIVIEDNKLRRLEPKILMLTNADKEQLEEPWDLDMVKHNLSIAPEMIRIVKGLADGAHGVSFREFYLRRQ